MSTSTSFKNLIEQAAAGREDAAVKIVDQHTDALVRIARQRIGKKLGQRVEPEDILQSVYRSFFVRLQEGQYEIEKGRDLWNLLVRMTVNKICRKATFHQREKRDFKQEQTPSSESSAVPLADLARADDPGPEDAVLLVEAVQELLLDMREKDRPVVELRLQGYTTVEIAKQTGRAERSVRRILERLKASLQQSAADRE